MSDGFDSDPDAYDNAGKYIFGIQQAIKDGVYAAYKPEHLMTYQWYIADSGERPLFCYSDLSNEYFDDGRYTYVGADFSNSNLADATFNNSNLAGADFTASNLTGAVFEYCTFTNMILPDGERLVSPEDLEIFGAIVR